MNRETLFIISFGYLIQGIFITGFVYCNGFEAQNIVGSDHSRSSLSEVLEEFGEVFESAKAMLDAAIEKASVGKKDEKLLGLRKRLLDLTERRDNMKSETEKYIKGIGIKSDTQIEIINLYQDLVGFIKLMKGEGNQTKPKQRMRETKGPKPRDEL